VKRIEGLTKTVAAWGSFDFANHSFSGIMTVFVFPIFFRDTIVTNGHGDAYWGVTVFLSMLLVALVTPLLGAMADVLRNKKAYLGIFTAVTILGTVALYFIQPGMVLWASVLYILANAGFEGGTVFYDAFLPEITTPKLFGRVSGIGFAFGYFGSLAILGCAVPFLDTAPKMTFLITALFFTVFAIPMFVFVPERRKASSLSFANISKKGFSELKRTFRHIREYRDIVRFLIAFFLYNDAILTVSSFSGIYAKVTLHFGMVELAAFFAMIQIIAVIGSIVFGKLADRFGSKRIIVITLFIWIVVIFSAYLTTTKLAFYFVGAGAGIALGSNQSCSRSLMALLTPPEHSAEFFGFYDGFCGKVSAIIGPVLFGVFSDLFGSERPAILLLAPMIVIGLLILLRVRETRPVPVYAV